jgi:hypothetical protein
MPPLSPISPLFYLKKREEKKGFHFLTDFKDNDLRKVTKDRRPDYTG